MTLLDRFKDRFHGLQRAYGTYSIKGCTADERGKIAGKAQTFKGELNEQHWKDHLNGITGLGVTPVNDDAVCRFGAIDVDVYDLSIEAVEKRVQAAELPLVACRTKSGGVHLYLFTSEPVRAELIRKQLMEWCILVGYPGVEVFPKQSELGSEEDIGSWINLPYFDAHKTMRYAVHQGKALKIQEFLDLADEKAVTGKQLAKIKGKMDDNLEGAPPCLQHLALSGFPQGTRNDGLYSLGVFVKRKFKDNWESKLTECNIKYMSPPLSHNEVGSLLKQLAKKDYHYKCKQPPLNSCCNKAVCVKREFGIDTSASDPGIVMDSLVKIMTDPPMWLVNVNEKRVKLTSSEDLLNQRKFVRICLDSHNILPNQVKDFVWRELIRDLVKTVEEVPAPQDAGMKGQFLYLLHRYCTEYNTTDTFDEILIGKVYAEKGRMYFQSGALLEYLKRKDLRLPAHIAWSILQDEGAETKEFYIGNKGFTAWSIPEITKPEIKFNKPKTINDESEF